jgi:cellulose synthase/poly-beta-1,6-N-acetylglucosamine synthase-like glycosyltransferase
MSYFVILISFGYAMTLLCLAMPALRYQPLAISRKKAPVEKFGFSVIVVYRNEELALPALLRSLKAQIYDPEFMELLFVNDDSHDTSQELIAQFSKDHPSLKIQLLDRFPTSNSAKKDGITQALQKASFDHILTTDADCILPSTWMESFNAHYQIHAGALLVAAPIKLSGHGFLAATQQLEMMALQTITAGAFAIRQPFMCNGANLSFKKNAFLEVNGYTGNDHISSGDDIFLLEKLTAEDVLQCHYLKDPKAIVETASKSSCKGLIQQRARWARKGKETKSLLNKLVAFQVAAMSLLFIMSPIFYSTELITLRLWISVYLIKFFTDFVVLVIGNQFLDMKKWSFYFIPNFLIYPFLVLAIGMKSSGTIEWRGRSIDSKSYQ